MTGQIANLERLLAEAEVQGIEPGRLAVSDEAAWELAVELAAGSRVGTPEAVYLDMKAGRATFRGLPISVVN